MQISSSSLGRTLPLLTSDGAAASKIKAVVTDAPVTSNGAPAIQEPQTLTFSDVGKAARAKLNSIYSDGAKSGIKIVYDNKDGGNFPDLSDWSDQELAAMALNRDKSFSNDEKTFAEGELTKRLTVALEPFSAATMSGDRRGHTMAINMLYSGMSQEVRDAMKWTPAMMASNNSMLDGDNKLYGPLDNQAVLRTLLSTKANGRITDTSFLESKVSALTYSLSTIRLSQQTG